MAYLARKDILYDEAYFHVTWQCHNQSWFLKSDWAKQYYYDLLLKYKDKYGVKIYSYSLMDNHPHLTGKTLQFDGISNLMKTVNSQFAKKINKLKNRKGQVVMDRFKSPVIQSGESMVFVMIYGDLNSYRAGIVSHPKYYRWSSYHYYANGTPDPLITPSPGFLELDSTIEGCREKYKQMVDVIVNEEKAEKRDYSTVLYIGDPDWVRDHYERIKEIKRAKREAYLRRQLYAYTNGPPAH